MKTIDPFEYSLKLINKYSYSTFTMKQKLKQKGFNDSEINKTINKLIKNNLLNDKEYASDYASILLKRNKGPLYIKNKLILKGIDKSIIEEVINNIEEIDLNKNLINAIKKLKVKYKDKKNEDIKIINALQRMGYSYSIVIDKLKEIKI